MLGGQRHQTLFTDCARGCDFRLRWPGYGSEMEMSKLTCKEIGQMPASKMIGIPIWMNGYVHGKAGNAMLDGDMAEANAQKIAAYCKKHPDATLASAIKAVDKL